MNLHSMNAKVLESREYVAFTAEIEVEDLVQLSTIIDRLRRISGVQDVRRVSQ